MMNAAPIPDDAEEQAKMAALSRMAQALAGELRELVAALAICLPETAPAMDDDKLQSLRRASRRAGRLVAQLQALGPRPGQPRAVDLSDIVAEVEPELRQLAGRDVELVLQLADVGPVWIDAQEAQRAVLALAVHARGSMPDGGQLTMVTREIAGSTPTEGGRSVELTVTNSGGCLAPEARTSLFEPRFRGDGLGLAGTWAIVQQAGGRIQVQSTPGEGTKIHVILPRFAQPSSAVPLITTETLLLVDDEAVVRHVAREVLRRLGYRVLEAESGSAALRLLDGHDGHIHLLLTDVMMPGMSGPELVLQFTPRRPLTRVLFMSGHDGQTLVDQGILRPDAAFLQKPFNPEALARRVRQLLDQLAA